MRKNRGITLIALVVTIIILIILAGISINLVLGENGIIKRAQEAKVEMDKAQEKEALSLAVMEAQIGEDEELDHFNLQEVLDNQFGDGKVIIRNDENDTFTASFVESKKDYVITSSGINEGIDWNIAMQNAKAPESQDEERNNGVIGIGTDGKPVDMDLWEYTLLEDGTYGLNDEEALNAYGSNGTAGYLGDFTNEKGIIGTVPQYISVDNGITFVPVTSLKYTFTACNNGCEELKIAPKIPNTIKSMETAFYQCNNLTYASNIPNEVVNLRYTFALCSNLTSMPNIGANVEDFSGAFQNCTNLINTTKLSDSITLMSGSFLRCTSLKKAPELPKNVVELNNTFQECTSLEKAPSIIPEKAQNMQSTFQDCSALKTPPAIIPSSAKKMKSTFVNCSKLSGNIEINAEPEEYSSCFANAATVEGAQLKLTGTCSVLQELREQGGNII